MRLETSAEIDAPPESVWTLLVDTERWDDWGISVREVDCDSRYISSDTEGRVKTPLGWVPFRITEYDEGVYWRWRVLGVPATGHRVRSLGDGDRCELVFDLPWYEFAYLTVCKHAIDKISEIAESS